MNTSEEFQLLLEESLYRAISKIRAVSRLRDAVEYVLFPGGKRIRPNIALSVCSDLGGDVRMLADASIALELIHCSSLIHDDLPALDNDDIRRGRPSCHKQFNEGTALLTGDYLIAFALNLLCQTNYSENSRLEFIRTLTSAYMSLCNGQELDIMPREERGDLAAIHFEKTGALFGASFRFGGIGAGVDTGTLDMLTELGLQVGFGFQLADDYLDVTSGANISGRMESSDARNDKETYFSNHDERDGLRVLTDARRKIDDLFGKFALSGKALPKAKALVDEIFASVDFSPELKIAQNR